MVILMPESRNIVGNIIFYGISFIQKPKEKIKHSKWKLYVTDIYPSRIKSVD